MNIIVEKSIRSLMPDVVIEFLRGIVRKDDTISTIRLVPVKSSFDDIQEIVCENKSGTTTRRVFGFTPVRAMLNVSRGNGEVVMRLAA